MSDASLVLVGMVLGFTLVIPPGPMNALIAARSVRSLRTGVMTGLGAMSADLVLGTLVYGLHAEIDLAPVVRWIEAGGAAVMALFAYRLLRWESRPRSSLPDRDARVFSEALLVGVANPFQVIWWLTAGLAFAYLGGLLLLAGLFAAIGAWILAFPLALHHGTRRLRRAPRVVAVVSAVLLAGFAVYVALLAAGLPP